jgi:hypothetical protein
VGGQVVAATGSAGLLLVGKVFDAMSAQARELERTLGDGVLFTGQVPYERLPEFMSQARVGIAPFVLSPRTRATNPNKLYMYAAMDMNIVSTPFSPEIDAQREHIFVESDRDRFAAAVREALGDESRRRVIRESVALPNSWDRKAEDFRDLLVRVVGS